MRGPGPILLPMLHPAYLFRTPTYAYAALRDWQKAVRIQREGPTIIPPPYEEWQWRPTFEQARTRLSMMMGEGLRHWTWINDWEATLDGRPYCGAFGPMEDLTFPGWCLPIRSQGGGMYWTGDEWAVLFPLLRAFLEDPTIKKGNHNYVGYDYGVYPWNSQSLMKRAWNIDVRGGVLDTMVGFYNSFAELKRSLSFCNSVYTDMGPYKTEVHEVHKGDDPDEIKEEEPTTEKWAMIHEIPDQQLRCYCLDDEWGTRVVGRGVVKEMAP